MELASFGCGTNVNGEELEDSTTNEIEEGPSVTAGTRWMKPGRDAAQ